MAGVRGGCSLVIDKRKLDQLDREHPGKAGQVVEKIARMCEGYIKTHMSPTSPSSPGDPPAVVTSTLLNSIQVDGDPGNERVWYLHVGADYGLSLEFGTMRMAARPFVRPAVHWTALNLPSGLLAEVIE